MYYSPAINVYIHLEHYKKLRRLAGMLRGLANSYDGFIAVSRLSNARFAQGSPVRFRFRTVRKAHAFQRVVEAVLGRYVKTKKLVRRASISW